METAQLVAWEQCVFTLTYVYGYTYAYDMDT